MSKTFQFGDGYELRLATPDDLDRARAWTNADEHHRGRIAPEFWTEQSNGVESYILKDAAGEIFFFRVERVARIFIQFPAGDGDMNAGERLRIKNALIAGVGWLAMALGTRGYGEIIFDSTAKLLRFFATAWLKFEAKPDTLSRRLQIFVSRPKAAPEAVSEGKSATEGQESLQEPIHDGLQGVK